MQAYLAKGTIVAFDVLPEKRTIRAITRVGATTLVMGERFVSIELPWLQFDVDEVFANLPN